MATASNGEQADGTGISSSSSPLAPPIRNVNFGREARELLYGLDPRTTFVNHGSYGVAPRQLLKKRLDLILEQDSSPDKWFRYTSPQLMEKNVAALGAFLGVESAHLALFLNATDALNTVIRSVDLREEDNIEEEVILASQYTYNSVANALHYTAHYRTGAQVCNHFGPVKVFQVACPYPITSVDQVLDAYERMCELLVKERRYRIKLAVVDHISSESATLFPVKEICQIIRKWSQRTTILVDGSHAIGQVEIKLNEVDCDYYVSNLHKWFLLPRSCAFLFARDLARADARLQPSYISHGYLKPWSVNSRLRGTVDLSQFFLIDDCIRLFTNYLGNYSKIRAYNTSLADRAADMLAAAWGTSRLEVPKELEAPYLKLIKMPPLKSFPAPDCSEMMPSEERPLSEETIRARHRAEDACFQVVKALYDRYNVDTFVSFVQNTFYLRISCYIYNEFEDYEVLRDAVLDLAKN